MMTSERRHSLSKERKSCRARILRMLKEKHITVEELMTLYEEKNIFLFKGHDEKELYIITLLEDNAIDMLVGNVQNWSSLHRKIIGGTASREGCTLEEFGGKKLHKDVRAELDRMIQNEMEQNKKQEKQNKKQEEQNAKKEKETTSISRRRWNVAVRLVTDKRVHLIDVIRLTGENHLILSNRTFCGESVTHDNMLNFSSRATCRTCLKEDARRNNQEK